MIVMNENKWAKEMIDERSLGKKPYETLRRVARYYIDELGYEKKDVRNALDEFILACNPASSLVKWSDTADRAVSHAMKNKAIIIDSIDITEPELNKISTVDSIQAQRLAFTLLCLSRYWDIANGSSDHWVNTKDNEIMKMANVSVSTKRQCLLYSQLNELGMVQFSRRVDNTNVRVVFCEDGDTAMSITDLRNLGYQYLLYRGGPYKVCESCGLTFKLNNRKTGRPQKYCPSCAAAIRIQQSVSSVMRRRAPISEQTVN